MNTFLRSREYLDALSGSGVASRLAEAHGISIVQREYEKSIAALTSMEKFSQLHSLSAPVRDYTSDFLGLNSSKILQEALGMRLFERESIAVAGAQSTAKMLKDSFVSSAAMREYANAFDITSQVKKLAGIEISALQSDYLKTVERASAASKLTDSVSRATAQLDFLKGTESASWIQQLSKSMVDEDLYRRFLGTLNIGQSASSDVWASAAEVARQRYDRLFSGQEGWASQIERLKRPEYLDTLLADIERGVTAWTYDAEDFSGANVETEGEELLSQLAKADSPERFGEILSRCPHWIKWVLINLLMYVVLPAMIGISVNLVTPQVEQYLRQYHSVPQREQIKDIKKLSMGELGVELRGYRFVTASTLVLRANANSRAAKVAELQFGQVVAVISSKRDWTEVAYEYGDGQTITGWVFTRYTAKFRR